MHPEKEQFKKAKDNLKKFACIHPELFSGYMYLTTPETAEVPTSLSNINNLFSPDAYIQSAGNALEARSVLHSLEGNKEKKNGGNNKENGEDNKENVEGEGITVDE